MPMMLIANGSCVWSARRSEVPAPPLGTNKARRFRALRLLLLLSTKFFVTVTRRQLHAGRTLHRWLHETKLRVIHKKGHCHRSGVIRIHHHQIQEIGTSAFQAVDPTVAHACCQGESCCSSLALQSCLWINIYTVSPNQWYKHLFYHLSSQLFYSLSLLGLGTQNWLHSVMVSFSFPAPERSG